METKQEVTSIYLGKQTHQGIRCETWKLKFTLDIKHIGVNNLRGDDNTVLLENEDLTKGKTHTCRKNIFKFK